MIELNKTAPTRHRNLRLKSSKLRHGRHRVGPQWNSMRSRTNRCRAPALAMSFTVTRLTPAPRSTPDSTLHARSIRIQSDIRLFHGAAAKIASSRASAFTVHHTSQPGSSLVAILAVLVHPQIGMSMDHLSLRNIEQAFRGHLEKSEVGQIQMIFEVITLT